MTNLSVGLNDLPDEILIYIFKKMSNAEVLYYLMGINQRLNRIVHDPIFTRDLYIIGHSRIGDSIEPLHESVLNRFCSTILPEIGHSIKTLALERAFAKRILCARDYPNLRNLALHNISFVTAGHLFKCIDSFSQTFKKQISSFYINFNNEGDDWVFASFYSIRVTCILSVFTNLQSLTCNLSYSVESLSMTSEPRVISLNLLELHIVVRSMDCCLHLLDGRFHQLRVFDVIVDKTSSWSYLPKPKQKQLPSLHIFSLTCLDNINDFDKVIVSLLRRMICLKELYLNIIVECNEKFIDGDTLTKDIIVYIPRLSKFTFNIRSIISHYNQTNFPLNEHIQKTFKYFYNTQIVSCIDHFHERGYSQCHIYSYPYNWKYYFNVTNNFQGRLFNNVHLVSLYDEKPFEYEFFLRIAQSFPFMNKLIIKNQKAQINKQLIKSNNDNQTLSVIEYRNLIRLDLTGSHDNYVELFLFNTNISLLNNIHLDVDYEPVKRVTNNFTSYKTENNCAKVCSVVIYKISQLDERIKDYFPYLF